MATRKREEEEGRISQDIAGASSRYTSGTRGSGYRPNDTSGNDYASLSGMSDLDKAALEAAGNSYNQAYSAGDQAGMDAAHQQAEAIRNKYGYSGGSDGSQYIPFGSVSGEFSYESAPSYVSRYQSQIDALTEELLNRDPFEYNYLEDPTYQQYAESYTRAGERAMQDVLAQVSARTGGLASSYATTASQQTYDNYMQALADKVPELQQLAYSMYMDEGDAMRANLDMLLALENGDYGRYQDLLTQYNNDRNFAYGQYRDGVSDDRYNLEWQYGVGRDQISDQRYQDETAYNREQDAWNREQYESETEYNRALDRAQTLAQAGDFSGYRALGYSDAEIASLQNAYNRAQAAAALSRSDGGTDGDSGDGSLSGDIYQQMYDAGIRSYDDAYAWLRANGIGSTDANRYANGLVNKIDAGDFEAEMSLNDLNTDSVLQLGIGPLSFEAVENLADEGKITLSTDSSGKIVVRWANGYNADNYQTNLRDLGFFNAF